MNDDTWLTPQTMTKHIAIYKHLSKIYIIWASYSDIFAAGFHQKCRWIPFGASGTSLTSVTTSEPTLAPATSSHKASYQLPLALENFHDTTHKKKAKDLDNLVISCACGYSTSIFYTWCFCMISTFLWSSTSWIKDVNRVCSSES